MRSTEYSGRFILGCGDWLGVDRITSGPKRSPLELTQKKWKVKGESQRQLLTIILYIKAFPPDCSQECLAVELI